MKNDTEIVEWLNDHAILLGEIKDDGESEYGTMKAINTPSKPTTKTSEQATFQQIFGQSSQNKYQNLKYSVQDFLARHSAWLESGKDLKMIEGTCFLRLAEYLKLKDLSL